MMELSHELYLPRLRQDLQLNPAPPEEGAPTWTLYDPAANKYYKIGWLEFECLSRFKRCQTGNQLIALIMQETTLEPEEADIQVLVNFLLTHKLVHADNPGMLEYLEKERAKREHSWWQKAMHGYLYISIPLFKPQKFLKRTFPYVRFMFTRAFFACVLLLLGYGMTLTLQRWDEVAHTFMSYFSLEGVFYLLIATIFVKVAHEMGHAYMATKYGVPVHTMGVALMVMYPVLYAETTNSWKMMDRRDRIFISMAGVMAEMTIASVALLLWHMLPPGIPQSICFMVAIVSLAASLLVNLNPLMRFDGYYLFSDLVGIDNLQDRSFAFAKWKLRSWLFGWNDGPPELLAQERRNLLVIFGFATIVYRFFLFTGIAFLVYFLFFKPLGLILFLVEIVFFILLPIWREVYVWLRNGKLILSSGRGKMLLLLAFATAVFCFMPAQSTVEAPAVLHASNYVRIYPPTAARVVSITAYEGAEVKKGDVLFQLMSPKLDNDIAKARLKLTSLIGIRDREQASAELVRNRPTLESDIENARKELEGHETQKARMTVTAPFDGRIRDLDTYVHEGMWLHPGLQLAVIIGPEKLSLSGYVSEQDTGRLKKDATGWFYSDLSPFKRYPVALKRIEDTDTTDIFWPELSSVFGGALPAERARDTGTIRPLARHPIYAAQFSLTGDVPPPAYTTAGTVVLEAAPVSYASLLAQRFMSLVMRESGF